MFENFFGKKRDKEKQINNSNGKNSSNKGIALGMAGALATSGVMQATDKPPVPDNTNTPPTKEFKVPKPQPTLEEQAKAAGLREIVMTSPGETTNAADFDGNGNPIEHITKTPNPVSDTIIRETMANYPAQEETVPRQKNVVDQNTIDTKMKELTKAELGPNYTNLKNIPTGPTADNPENTRQEPVIQGQHDQSKEESLPEYNMPEIKEIPEEEGWPLMVSNNTHTLDLTDQLNESGANSYNTGDKKFGMPESTPLQGEQQNNQNKKETGDGQTAPNQQQSPDKKPTPDKPSSLEEESPEPTNPPKRLDVDGPTAIVSTELNSGKSEILPEKLGDAIETIKKYLPKLTKTQMTAILTSMLTGLTAIQETQAAGTLNHQDINNNQTEHTLSNTEEAHNRATQHAWLDYVRYPEANNFTTITPEEFLKQYQEKYPTVSVNDLKNFIFKMSTTNTPNKGRLEPEKGKPVHKIIATDTNEMDAMLGNLSTVKAPGKGSVNEIGIGQNYGLSNTPAYSTPPSQPKKPYTTDKLGGRHYSSKYNDVTISPRTYEGGIAVEPE